MLRKLYKPFYTVVVIISILIMLFYLKENSFNINLNSMIIILISVLIENMGYYNEKENSTISLSLSISVFILFIFGPLISILAVILLYTIPPVIEDIKNLNIKTLYQKLIKITFNISQGIINVFISERVLYFLNFDINNTLDIWKIIFVVLAHYYSNAILITLIISFSKGEFTKDLISIRKNYNFMFNFIILTPILIYNYSDRGFIGLILVLIIIHTMAKSIEVYKRWKEHEEKIFRDELTGTYNYRYFNSIIDSNIILKKEFTLMIIDIDNFKAINDNYGHIAGDYVLKNLANAMYDIVKEEGILCRHGGDEFSIIINSHKKTFNIASSISKCVDGLTIKYKDDNLKVDLSIGYYCYKGDNDITKEQLIDRADKAMYKAKTSNPKVRICEAI